MAENNTFETVGITINGMPFQAKRGTTVLLAAREAGIDIPSLCFMKDINEVAACRVCVVEADINGVPLKNLPASCRLMVEEGMNIRTNTPQVREAVRTNVELILANHNRDCTTCRRNGCCELQKLCDELGIDEVPYAGDRGEEKQDDSSDAIVRDPGKCILCGRCVYACKYRQKISVLDFTKRGLQTEVAPAFHMGMQDVDCIYCGQCIQSCPVSALREKDSTEDVWAALADPSKYVIVQTAPAVRAALGEEFGFPMGTAVTGKMNAALRRIGFDRVFDMEFGADLTVVEESAELIRRLSGEGKLPMITSCSAGWVRYCEMHYPQFLENLCTCKSPQQMFGAMAKSYFAQKAGIDPRSIVCVSVAPCIAKKAECHRRELSVNGIPDVDYVLTTRELARMIKQARIRFEALPDESSDPLMGEGSGAGAIFGVTGGVAEAVLRTAADMLTGEDISSIEYREIRGLQGVRMAAVNLTVLGQRRTLKIAVAHGTARAAELLAAVSRGELDVQFIEIMACPGGCIHGGGQPVVSAKRRLEIDPLVERAKALYAEDQRLGCRKSHQNPDVQAVYRDFLDKPGSEKAMKYLHTAFTPKETYCKR